MAHRALPTGWGHGRPDTLRPCPVCFRATETYVSPAKTRLFTEHTRTLGNGAKVRCPGTNRPAGGSR